MLASRKCAIPPFRLHGGGALFRPVREKQLSAPCQNGRDESAPPISWSIPPRSNAKGALMQTPFACVSASREWLNAKQERSRVKGLVRPAAKRGHGPLTLWSDPHAQGWGVGKKGACDRLPRTPATWRTAPLAGEGRGGVVGAARCPNLAPKLADSGGSAPCIYT